MNLDVKIEVIVNGFVITGNDSVGEKRYYPTLEAFALAYIVEDLREKENALKHHEQTNTIYSFTLKTDL